MLRFRLSFAALALILTITVGAVIELAASVQCRNTVRTIFDRNPPATQAQRNVVDAVETRWTYLNGCEARAGLPWRKVE